MHKTTKTTVRICLFATVIAIAMMIFLPVISFADEAVIPEESTPADNELGSLETVDTVTEGEYGEGFFTALFSAFEENLSQILSALAFIGSLIIMLCYKRGLLPLLTDGLSAITATVKKLGEKTSELNTESAAVTEKINGRLKDAEKLLLTMETSLTSLNSRLDKLDGEREDKRKLYTVLMAEVDMLYEIFNSAALPQYLKDRVGERISDMKAEISEIERNEEC